jgi:hypothetical protein
MPIDTMRLLQFGAPAALTPPPSPQAPPPPPTAPNFDRFIPSQPFTAAKTVTAPDLLPGVWPRMTPVHITPASTPGASHTITLTPVEAGKAFGIYPAIPDMKAFVEWFGHFDRPEVLGPTEYVPASGTSIKRDQPSAPASVRALQVSLGRLGYPVQPTGQFDQATMSAVVNFRRANNLHEAFRDPTGAYAVLPFADQTTRMAILSRAGA